MQLIEQIATEAIGQTFDFFGKRSEKYKQGVLADPLHYAVFAAEDDEAEHFRLRMIEDALETPSFKLVLHLCLAQILYPEFHKMLKDLTGKGVTLRLALGIAEELETLPAPLIRDGYENLAHFLNVKKSNDNFLFHEFSVDERLLLYLTGDDALPSELEDSCRLYFPDEFDPEEYYAFDELCAKVSDELRMHRESEEPYLIQFAGPDGSGRKSALRACASAEGALFLTVDQIRLLRRAERERDADRILWLLFREVRLYRCDVCMENIPEDIRALDLFATKIVLPFAELPVTLIVNTPEKTELACHIMDVPVRLVTFPMPGAALRMQVFKGIAESYGIKIDAERFGAIYRLTFGQIRRVLDSLRPVYVPDETEAMNLAVTDLCAQLYPRPAKGSIRLVDARYKLADLKLPEEQTELLARVCNNVNQAFKVYNTWGMEKKYAYGRSVSVLFYGPPGTGKTMAAGVLSSELKIPLYHIDLSQVVDKYIGETEKRLEEIFAYAQNTNVILFFDEADAIFGKRTEVNEAKDKYANTEVSFILQRIEEYNGIVVLATNLKQNIDNAFMRRMKYVIRFDMPDAATRKDIWKGCFSSDIPVADDVDFDFLSERIELSGGYIKNIVLNAAFMAAAGSGRVSMREIIRSTANEYSKNGAMVALQDFEPYTYLL